MDFVELGYIGMFVSAFLAATILPLGSEVVFTALLYKGLSPIYLVFIASVGNTLGGMVSFYMGWIAKWQWLSKWFKISQVSVTKYLSFIKKHGAPAAILTWLPAIGDILAVALGFAKTKPIPTYIWMFIGKFFRFMILAYLWQKISA